jgi:hypothetical protein
VLAARAFQHFQCQNVLNENSPHMAAQVKSTCAAISPGYVDIVAPAPIGNIAARLSLLRGFSTISGEKRLGLYNQL